MNKPFLDAVTDYPHFKTLFKKFCDTAAKWLNGNVHLPGVNFSARGDGASAQLQAFDRTFEISLHFLIVENPPRECFKSLSQKRVKNRSCYSTSCSTSTGKRRSRRTCLRTSIS